MSKIQDKVVIIMGASSGIGEATAKLLVNRGAKLVLAARRLNRLEAIKEEYQEADVTKYEEVTKVVDLALEKHSRIDVLYNK